MDASNCRKSPIRPATTGASTMKLDCGVMTLDLQREVNGPFLVPENDSKVHARTDLPYLVANMSSYDRGAGVIEHDAFLTVEPTFALVYLGDNRINAEGQQPVAQSSMHRVEGLALPSEQTDDFGDSRREHCSGRNDRRTLSFPTRNVTGRTAAEKIVQ